MSIKLTEEQENTLKIVENSAGTNVGIQACAGAGKTFILKKIVDKLECRKVLYTAFNKAIILDSAREFPVDVECKTIHALAYRYAPSKDIKYLSPYSLNTYLKYEEKQYIVNTIDEFFLSDSTNMFKYFKDKFSQNYDEKGVDLRVQIATEVITDMIENKMPITFSFMLKFLHLCLVEKRISIDYDLLLVDECQDTFPVSKEILSLINAKYKIFAGDINQDCYNDFLGTVNAFKELKMTTATLTKSFRCNTEIAIRIEQYGKKYIDKDFCFTGVDNSNQKRNGSMMYISRTNLSIIERMQDLNKRGIVYRCTRDIKDIFELPLAIASINKGEKVKGLKYKYLNTIYQKFKKDEANNNTNRKLTFFTSILNLPELADCVSAVKILQTMEYDEFIDIKNVATRNKKLPTKVILSTAHSSKGLEVDEVYIEDDLNYYIKNLQDTIVGLGKEKEKENFMKEFNQSFKLGYIASSRAKFGLLNCRYMRK